MSWRKKFRLCEAKMKDHRIEEKDHTVKKLMLIVLFMIASSFFPIMAQEEPAETVQATEAAAQTVEPTLDVTAEPTLVATATPEPPAPPPASTDGSGLYYAVVIVVLIGMFALAIIDRVTNYRLQKIAVSQIPPEWVGPIMKLVETAQQQGFERAAAIVQETPQDWDDNLLKEAMKSVGWELYIGPDGKPHPRRIVTQG